MDAVLTSSSAHADIALSAQRFARALLHHAPPGHPDAGFFATLIGTSLAHHNLARSGLCPKELADLLDYLFPDALASQDARLAALGQQFSAYAARGRGDPQPGFTLLVRVLLEAYRAPDTPTTPWVTGVLVHACLRPDHLWRDLGLSGREDLTFVLARHYPGLVMRNARNLRWKQFLAYSACEHAGLPPSAAPGCFQCEDHGACYANGPD